MSKKQFSMLRYWDETTKNHTPELSFMRSMPENFVLWHKTARKKYLDLLGEFPKAVSFNTEVEYELPENELIRERINFDVEENMSIPCYVLRLKSMKLDGSNPAVVCIHGHEPFAKDTMAGMRITTEHDNWIDRYNYNMGEILANKGYLTICPDLRGFGERRDYYDPIGKPSRDTCNVQMLKGAVLGKYTMTYNIFDIMRCVDYLTQRPEVDASKIGALGIGLGGAYSIFAAAVDERIKAVDCAGFLNPWRKCAIERGANICGAQFVPDLWKWFDTSDIAGMLAGKTALLLEMGINDQSFPFADLMEGYENAKRIFEAAGQKKSIWTDIHTGGHEFANNRVSEFFDYYLKGER